MIRFLLLMVLLSKHFLFASSLDMTLEEMVGQTLFIHFNGEEANEDAKMLIQNLHVGEIIYYNFSNGLTSFDQVKNLSLSLQKLAKENSPFLPLFIAVDQEGGLVTRLQKGFTHFPGNLALAKTQDSHLCYLQALAISKELLASGINMNLAPVVDINSNLKKQVGIRSFDSEKETIAIFAKEAIKGYQEASIISCLKHFPGIGATEVDSHTHLPILSLTKKELGERELYPYKILAKDAPAIMTGHILIPSIDPIFCATQSEKILSILRKEIGFEGVIISDSLIMESLLKNSSSIEEAAISSIKAGCDLLILGGKQLLESQNNLELTPQDVARIHQSIVNAVKTGVISKERLKDAVTRILRLKKSYHLAESLNKLEMQKENVQFEEHGTLAKKISDLAISKNLVKSSNLKLKNTNVLLILPKTYKDFTFKNPLTSLCKNIKIEFFQNLNVEEILSFKEQAKKNDLIIFFSKNAWKLQGQQDLILNLSKEKPTILVALENPHDLDFFPDVSIKIATYGPSLFAIESALETIQKLEE